MCQKTRRPLSICGVCSSRCCCCRRYRDSNRGTRSPFCCCCRLLTRFPWILFCLFYLPSSTISFFFSCQTLDVYKNLNNFRMKMLACLSHLWNKSLSWWRIWERVRHVARWWRAHHLGRAAFRECLLTSPASSHSKINRQREILSRLDEKAENERSRLPADIQNFVDIKDSVQSEFRAVCLCCASQRRREK